MQSADDSQSVVLADGVLARDGDRVFSHYSMRQGTLKVSFGFDGWHDLIYDDGTRDYLNGERMCGLAHARRMGWLS